MTGLERIINQILEEANNSAEEKLAAARQEAEKIIETAKEEAARAGEEISKRSEIAVSNYKERVKSSNDLTRRTAVLNTKQEVISEIIEKVYQSFCARDGEEYWNTIKEMLNTFALAQDGDIYFSKRDLDRMPMGFESEISKVAEEKGGKLTLSKESRVIDGGFVLAYGGIEENCSFKALFDSKEDDFRDQVQKILFS